ncbi:partial Ornithine aminotransferase, partial [Gammaproteobacteria bacterium]
AIGLDRIAARCREVGALLVVDEIFTGLGRAGTFWAHRGVTPDLVCAGKALGGGVPLSACLGREEVMAAWGDPSGEAIHTATFAGHPLACATGLAQLDVIERERLVDRSRDEGARWLSDLQEKLRGSEHVREVRGRGLMIGVELDGGARTLRVVRALLERGWITLPAGAKAEVLSLTPPLSIARELLDAFTEVLAEAIAQY